MPTRSHSLSLVLFAVSHLVMGCNREVTDGSMDDARRPTSQNTARFDTDSQRPKTEEVVTAVETHKTTSSAELPPKGEWIGPGDPRFEELERQAAERRLKQPPDDPQFDSLMLALEANDGNFTDALTAMGLHLDVDNGGCVTRIDDPMVNGQFDNEEFSLLCKIPTLRMLSLRDADVTDEGLAVLAEMPQLTRLSLDADDITDQGLIHLRHLGRLEELFLEGTGVRGSGLEHVRNPERLKWLDLTRSPITDAGLEVVARFTNLDDLGLWETHISDEGLLHLRACRRLTNLNLYFTRVTDKGVKTLVALPAIETLDLSETDTTDACLDDLLRMPKLTDVSFGSEQISVSTVERLRDADIDVSHGQLLNVRRQDNLLRYLGMDFEVDREQSTLKAFIHVGEANVVWALSIECTDSYVPSHMQPAHLEGPPMLSDKNWKDLVGEEFRISYDEQELHPILPDNPSNIYVGWHAAPNNHYIKFQRRIGRRFLVDWRCEAKETRDDPGEPIWLHAEIPFAKVTVWSEEPISMGEAKQQAANRFDLAELHKPTMTKENTRFAFRVRDSQ